MPRALCLLRDNIHYRKDAFEPGLKNAGFELVNSIDRPAPEDVLVIWNRYGRFEAEANRFEKAGATVLVAENGYIGADQNGDQFYAISRSGHNGSGTWEVGGAERWDALGIEIAPWREGGDYILVCGQRGIGTETMRSPNAWHWRTSDKLREITGREVVVRPHPKDSQWREGLPSLDEHLAGAFAVVVWASSVAGKALVQGIPVFVGAPYHILDGAVERDFSLIDTPPKHDRLPAFQRMAWAQWSLDEIESGEPFRVLCGGAK